MQITVKTKKEIDQMKKGGAMLAEIVKGLKEVAKEGNSSWDIELEAQALLKKYKVKSAFLDYHGYPCVTCVGLNDVSVHGIPSKDEIFKKGDIVSIDMGLIYEGLYLDHAVTVGVGEISSEDEKLLNVTRDAMMAAINQAKAGNRVGDLSNAMQTVSELAGFSVIRDMVGHGVGYAMHEPPQIPCFGEKGKGEVLKEGMTIAIEAMVNVGSPDIMVLDDGWTTKTVDGENSAIFEHTLVVGKKKAEILTK